MKNNLEKTYRNRRVLITGHTGFKGSWLTVFLKELGASVYGYALEPENENALFTIINGDRLLSSEIGDIRDFEHLNRFFSEIRPEIVFHLAAQPLVITSYQKPRETYETNVMGTVNICECVRQSDSVRSFLNVTTDKVYKNLEWEWGYRETDVLDGFDPYSNSKSCSELVTGSYKRAFFEKAGIPVSTARAGNVIGGGDYAENRIIPDCVRAAAAWEKIIIRNPRSIRPFQHVLEPLYAYLLIAAKQLDNPELAGSYNVGPEDSDCISVGDLAEFFCKAWGEGAEWESRETEGPHEAARLKLDCSRIRSRIGWKPRFTISEAINETVEWYRAYEACRNSDDRADAMTELMKKQIRKYMGD